MGNLFKAAAATLAQAGALIDDTDVNARRFNHSRNDF